MIVANAPEGHNGGWSKARLPSVSDADGLCFPVSRVPNPSELDNTMRAESLVDPMRRSPTHCIPSYPLNRLSPHNLLGVEKAATLARTHIYAVIILTETWSPDQTARKNVVGQAACET